MRRIGKRTNSAIFLLLMGFAISSVAEPKMLVCESSAEAEEERIRGQVAQARERAKDARDPTFDLNLAKRREASANTCINAKYGWQFNFTFDTKGLSSAEFSKVEVQYNWYCGARVENARQGTIEATPTIITFKWADQLSSGTGVETFNVDRKNLTGGLGTDRNYTCVLSDIDTSENLL
jgi:hypothetical protein